MVTFFKVTLIVSAAVFLGVNVAGIIRDLRKRKQDKKNAETEKTKETFENQSSN